MSESPKNYTLTRTHNAITLIFNRDSLPQQKYESVKLRCSMLNDISVPQFQCVNSTVDSNQKNCTCTNLRQLVKYDLDVLTYSKILDKTSGKKLPQIITSNLTIKHKVKLSI